MTGQLPRCSLGPSQNIIKLTCSLQHHAMPVYEISSSENDGSVSEAHSNEEWNVCNMNQSASSLGTVKSQELYFLAHADRLYIYKS